MNPYHEKHLKDADQTVLNRPDYQSRTVSHL